LHPTAIPIVNESKELFQANVAILSNSAGSSDDTDYQMAVETEKTMGIEVIRHKIKKPACLDEVVEHFQKKTNKIITPAQICVVGKI
jgi:phosphatidylglycerophosphatase GEP4